MKVVAAILRCKDKYLIARRAAHKALSGKWEFPGGKIEADESPETALKRELLEELGIECLILDHVITVYHNYSSVTIELVAFNVEYIKGDFILIDHDMIMWSSKSELLTLDLAEADLPILDKLD